MKLLRYDYNVKVQQSTNETLFNLVLSGNTPGMGTTDVVTALSMEESAFTNRRDLIVRVVRRFEAILNWTEKTFAEDQES